MTKMVNLLQTYGVHGMHRFYASHSFCMQAAVKSLLSALGPVARNGPMILKLKIEMGLL